MKLNAPPKRAVSALETSRTLHRKVAPVKINQIHNRSASDSVIYTESDHENQLRRSNGLLRTNAHVYQRVPLLLDSPTSPLCESPTNESFSTSGSEPSSSTSVSDEERSTQSPDSINESGGDLKDGAFEIVCGLPCNSSKKKKALLRTLAILEGRLRPESEVSTKQKKKLRRH